MRQNDNQPNGLATSIIDENIAVKIYDVTSWRCPLALLFSIIITELIFISIYHMDLEFVSTVIYLIIIFYIVRLFWSIFGVYINSYLFPEFPDENERETYRIQALNDLRDISLFIRQQAHQFFLYVLKIIEKPTLKVELYIVCILCLLFVFFTIIGTFWFSFFVYHLLFFLPKILQIQSVRKHVEEKIQPQKQKTKTD